MKDSLSKIKSSKNYSLYKIKNTNKHISEYIISSKFTRDLCNKPEITGYIFTEYLRWAFENTFKTAPMKNLISKINDKDVTVLHFLRGGLNFRLRDALFYSCNFINHYSSFMTSQRYKKKKKWSIKQDQYRKIKIPDNATIFLGDVVATGTTLKNGINVIIKTAKQNKRNIENFILFTVGCNKAENIITSIHKKLKKNFNYKNTYIFYVEGKFGLASDKCPLSFCIPGTDLLRAPGILSEEFELSQYDSVYYPLERCTIYDIGTKSFEYDIYLKEVISYWEKMKDSSMTLYEAYKQRWPFYTADSFEKFCEIRKKLLGNQNKNHLKQVYKKLLEGKKRLESLKWFSDKSLQKLAEKKIKILKERL